MFDANRDGFIDIEGELKINSIDGEPATHHVGKDDVIVNETEAAAGQLSLPNIDQETLDMI